MFIVSKYFFSSLFRYEVLIVLVGRARLRSSNNRSPALSQGLVNNLDRDS